jgi:hypothetical protein
MNTPCETWIDKMNKNLLKISGFLVSEFYFIYAFIDVLLLWYDLALTKLCILSLVFPYFNKFRIIFALVLINFISALLKWEEGIRGMNKWSWLKGRWYERNLLVCFPVYVLNPLLNNLK